jgi:hypothetical protein
MKKEGQTAQKACLRDAAKCLAKHAAALFVRVNGERL